MKRQVAFRAASGDVRAGGDWCFGRTPRESAAKARAAGMAAEQRLRVLEGICESVCE